MNLGRILAYAAMKTLTLIGCAIKYENVAPVRRHQQLIAVDVANN